MKIIIGGQSMATESIGDKIKNLRKKRKMSQEDLCKNICSQSEISRIENNIINPSSFILQEIANRFGVSIDYFNHTSNSMRDDYKETVKKLLERYRRNRNYLEIERIIQQESNSPAINNCEYMKGYMNWHRGIVAYHLHGDAELSLDILKSSLDLNEAVFSDLEIDILNSMGIICRNEKKYEDGRLYFEKALNSIKDFPFINRDRLFMKISYNLSKLYTDINLLEESLSLCENGIKLCKLNEIMYLYAEFHYQCGRNWIKKGNHSLGLEYWRKAIEILKIDDKTEFVQIIESEINIYEKYKKIV